MTNHDELTAALEGAGLLQDEYPDQMAARSCTCTSEAVCGAHRLLARYDQLFDAFQQANREKREAKAALRAAAAGSATPTEIPTPRGRPLPDQTITLECGTCHGEGGWYDASRQWETCYRCDGKGAAAGSATLTRENDDG